MTYSVLGMIAAMTGSLFGAALQNPFVVLMLAAILVALALSMFGLWEIRMPMFLARRTGSARQGYAGAVVMGLTMGIVAAPCIGPFVLGLLTYVGEMGKPLLGFFMFFTLAWGIGLPFLVLGTLSGSLSRLPRSGDWMVWVRKIFGFILVAMALYFVRHLAGPKLVSIGYAAIAIAGGIYLGWIDRAAGAGRGFTVLKRAVGNRGDRARRRVSRSAGDTRRRGREAAGNRLAAVQRGGGPRAPRARESRSSSISRRRGASRATSSTRRPSSIRKSSSSPPDSSPCGSISRNRARPRQR